MGALFRSSAACVLILLTTVAVGAQDLPPALAERFSAGVANLKAGQLDEAETAFRDVLRSGGERAFVHHNLGIVLRERGRHREALLEFRAAIKLDPSFGPARLLAGSSLLALARVREARAELERAIRLMPREVVAHVQLADACQRLGDHVCAADTYRRVVELAPEDPEYAFRLGSAYLSVSQWAHGRIATIAPNSARRHQALAREYLRQGRTELAERALRQAANADSTLPEIHLALARIDFDAGRLEEAAREIERELALVPSSKEALELQARIAAERGALPSSTRAQATLASPPIDIAASAAPRSAARRVEIEAAIRDRNWALAERLLAEEIERQPQSPELLALIARIFFLDAKPLNTAVALKKADAIAPLDDELRFTLVLAYIRLGRGDWARPELERLVGSDPNKAEYRYWLGRLDYDAGKYTAAISRFNEALARDPRFMRAHDNLGLCYEALDDVPEAIAHYREALRLNRQAATKSPWPATNLGVLLRQHGEPDEAASLFREALQYDPNFANGHYELGVLLHQQGRMDEAVQELARAASIDPAYPEPHYVLAGIYRRQGQAARAEEALRTFMRLRAARTESAK